MKIKLTGKRTLVTGALLVGVLWLYAIGSEKRREEGGGDGASETTTQCRVEATVDGLNIRSGPSVAPNNVVGELNRGDQTDAQKVVQGGFRKLAEGRWASAEFLAVVEGRDCG